MKYLNPLVDYVFKRIFGNPKHKEILIRFLNDFFNDPTQVIVDLQILNPLQEKEYPNDKDSALDIKAQTKDGRLINVEVQIAPDLAMPKRSLFYWSKMYSGQLASGEHYITLNKTVMINILSFDLFAHNDILSTYHITHDRSHERLTEDLEIHFVELRKLATSIQALNDELRAWLLFLTDPENNLLKEVTREVKEMKQAINLLEAISQSKEERERAESREKALKDQATLWELGMMKGLEQGMEKGRVDGQTELLWSQITKKFSGVSSIYHTQLKELDALRLKRLGEEILNIQSLTELDRYLGDSAES